MLMSQPLPLTIVGCYEQLNNGKLGRLFSWAILDASGEVWELFGADDFDVAVEVAMTRTIAIEIYNKHHSS